MPSIYILPDDYVTYGLPVTTTPEQIIQASVIIDGYLQRPEGLLYANDANGNPCYMINAKSSFVLNSVGSISPGTSVSVQVTGGTNMLEVGDVAILDIDNPLLTEACIVVSSTGNTLILKNVQFSHSAGVSMDFGKTILEDKNMPSGRPITTLSRWPIVGLISGCGRYGYGRRGSSWNSTVDEYNLLAAITTFGGPPIWEIFNAPLAGIDPKTATVWAPSGVLLAYYTQIRFWYVAGWTYNNLPDEIKFACANILLAILNFPIYGNIQSYRAGDTEIKFGGSARGGFYGGYVGASYLDDATIAMLSPYRTRTWV